MRQVLNARRDREPNSPQIGRDAQANGITPCGERNATNDQWLELLWLELTGKCNLQCIHCYTDSSPAAPLHQKVTPEDWVRLIEEAADLGCRRVQFIGGEPTIYPALPSLLRNAQRKGMESIEIYTNGTSFGDQLKQTLLDCDVALAFSVYAHEPEAHDAVTLRRGSHARTITNLKWALATESKVRVGVISTEGNDHLSDVTRMFLEELGVKSVSVDRVRGVGRGADGRPSPDPMAELCGRCWQARLCATAQGDVIPCVLSRAFPVGTVESGLASALRGDQLATFRKEMRRKSSGERHSMLAVHQTPGGCVPAGDPCIPEEGHPCTPLGGRRCIPDGGRCAPESPPCGPRRRLPPQCTTCVTAGML